MFIASVVCGHSKDYGRSKDRGLKRPPFREDSSSKLFDSIHSAPDDPSYGMWVVWQNAQAYPRYVVTYRSKCKQGSASSRSTAAQGLLRTLYGGSGGAASTMIDALIDASLPPPPPWVVPTIAEVRVACIKGDLTVLAAYLRAGGNPNAVDVDGVSLPKNKNAPMTGFCTYFCYYFQDFRDRTIPSGYSPPGRATRFFPTLSRIAAQARSATMAAWFMRCAASSGVSF